MMNFYKEGFFVFALGFNHSKEVLRVIKVKRVKIIVPSNSSLGKKNTLC